MTKFILVRHGKPTYEKLLLEGYRGKEFSWAPLSEEGVLEIEKLAQNQIFEDSDLLVSSPYTRTMQTASIIGQKYNLQINPNVLLHEWIPDNSSNYTTKEELVKNIRLARSEFAAHSDDENYEYNSRFEPLIHVRNRALEALEEYYEHDKVIVVAHSVLISMLFPYPVRLKTGEYIETTSEELDKNFKQKTLKKM